MMNALVLASPWLLLLVIAVSGGFRPLKKKGKRK